MSIFQAIVYGIIQGVGEFLPISSSGHLVVLPYLFNWKDQGLAFDIALHVGTLIAVVAFFWKDWINLLFKGVTKPKSKDGKIFWYLVLATIPAGVIGILFDDKLEGIRETNRELYTMLIGFMLITIGLILFFADKYAKNKKNKKEIDKLSLKDSLIIGASQALAVIPGTSRSGITMSTGLFRGLSREASARFSFLLSTPVIAAAGLLSLFDIKDANIELLPFVVAIFTSMIVGFLTIKFLLKFLQKHGFKPFVIYRIVLGVLLLILPFIK